MQMDGKNTFIGRLMGGAEKFGTDKLAQTIQILLEHGVRWQASDIHIEPHQKYIWVRYRIDGELRGAHKIAGEAMSSLVKQLKTMAQLDTSQSFTPQQGTFSTQVNNVAYDIKLSTMPVIGGEKVVLHIVPQVQTPFPLASLGFWGSSLSMVQSALARTHGMVLVSAPKHNGRPTTLASMVHSLNNPSLNIMTVEEIADYRIPHTSQTITNPRAGLTLASGLQAALQQDANVVMVSNLPDKATAESATHAAMSGHFILAGLHSESATGALMHLRAMGIEPYLTASATRIVVAQRLVRQLCEKCRERYALTPDQKQMLKSTFGITPKTAFRRIHELEAEAIEHGIGSDPRVGSSPEQITHLWRANREGCEACDHTGYQSRVALVEVLPMDEKMQHILVRPEITAADIQSYAIKEGFVPLALDGLVKALRGLVAINDVARVAHHGHASADA